jgi:hypothetical protein
MSCWGAGVVVPSAHGSLVFNELAYGDLSNDPLAPTALSLDLGGNWIMGSVDRRDRDYFSLKLPEGCVLAAVVLRASVGSEATFLCLQSGPRLTEQPDAVSLENLLGYASFFSFDVGTDLLPRLGQASAAIGFKGRLSGDVYTFWLEQASTAPTWYELEFVVETSIPSPGMGAIASAALGAGAVRRRRRQAFREAYQSPPSAAPVIAHIAAIDATK